MSHRQLSTTSHQTTLDAHGDEYEDEADVEREPDTQEQVALDQIRHDYGPPALLERWLAYHRLMYPEPTEPTPHERRSAAARRAAQTRKRHRAEAAAAVAEAERIIRAAQQ